MRTPTTLRRLLSSCAMGAAVLVLPLAAGAVAPTARYSHSSTLLSNSSILVAGGVDQLGNVLSSAEILKTNSGWNLLTGGNDVFVASMHVARASHTATFLPNGDVLVTGGVGAGGAALSSVEIYDPPSNTWTLLGGMSNARYNHTATLLNSGPNSGSVLICGGQDNTGVNVWSSCDLFTPTGAGAGTLSAGFATMLTARSLHSAVLLKDGTIWFAGGWNPGIPTIYLNATERYNPTTNTFSPSGALNDARAYHTATVMGDGRVMVAGGFNGQAETNLASNFGVLNATEIYDPSTDNSVAAAPLNVYRMLHTADLWPNGYVDYLGGYGNVQASSITYSGTFSSSGNNSYVDFTNFPNSTMTVLNPNTFQLGTQVTGTIVDGFVQWSNAVISFSSGTLSVNLAFSQIPSGTPVFCSNSNCGLVQLPTLVLNTVSGSILRITSPPAFAPVDLPAQGGSFSANGVIFIRRMVVATEERYAEAANQNAIPTNGQIDTRFQHTTVLTPSGDELLIGGQDCATAACTSFQSKNYGGPGFMRQDSALLPGLPVSGSSYFTTTTGSLATARAFHTATLLPDGRILVAGGENAPNNPLASAELLVPRTGVFSAAGPMSLTRSNHSATLMVNGRVLIAGGFTASASTQATNVAEIFYPDTNLFVPTSSMTFARANHTANLMSDGSIIVTGGVSTSGAPQSTVEVYSSSAVAWTTLTSLPIPLFDHTATLLQDGRLLVIGGQTTSSPSNQVFAYTPATNSWATLAAMPASLWGHTASELFDGRVLVAGGNNGFGEVNTSYFYDPVANAWSATTGSLTEARYGHTATLLPNNTVMISGGYTINQPTTIAPDIEVFHVDVGAWANTGVFDISPAFRAGHTMTLANNGFVYAIGGANGVIGGNGSVVLASAEKGYFTPAADSVTSGAPPSLRVSSITSISPYPFLPGGSFFVGGATFEGGTEASGGGPASMNSSFSFPHLVLQQIGGASGGASQADSGYAVDLTAPIYLNPANQPTLNTLLTVATPAAPQMPYGWYAARTGANDVYANGKVFQVGPALPSAAPTSLVGTPLGTSSITWTWGAVAGPIGGYDIYQASSSVFLGTAPVTSTTFIQTGLQPNTTGSIVVAAYTLSGDGPLAQSTTFYTLPAAPSLVYLSSVTPSTVLLQWNQSNNARGTVYEVSESTDNFATSFSTPIPASLLVTTNNVIVSALQSSTTYYFRLRAFNQTGQPSDFSPIVSTETTSGVGGIVGVALTPNSIQWSWTATPGATQYDVYVATSGQLTGTSTTTVFVDANLAVDSARGVLVAAVTGAGLGPLSPSTTIYTLANPPGPVSPDYMSLSTGGFVVNWTNNGNPPGITYSLNVYTIQRISGVDTFVASTVTTTALFAGVTNLSPSRYAQVNVFALNGNGIASAPYVLGSTSTLANPPDALTITATTPNSISVAWDLNGNSTSTFYQVTYSTDNFVTNVATAVPFAGGANLSTTTISGLLTSTTYWITVQAENKRGQLTSFSNTVTTVTFNGGAPIGLLQGVLPSATTGQIAGNLGNGEYVTVASPAGAFSYNTTVLISSFNVAGPVCPGAVGTPGGIGIWMGATPALLPTRTLLLSLAYTNAQLGSVPPGSVTIMRYVPSSGVCVPLNTSANTNALTLTAQINDFGFFVVAAPPAYGSADTARAFPSPYHVNRDGYVTIDQIPAGSRVRIMDLRGDTVLDQVANQSGLVTWSATNGSGRPVTSGLYLVVVEGGGTKKILKLAVIR